MIQPKATFLLFAGLISTALGAVNSTQEFHIRSQVVSGPERFGNLYRKSEDFDESLQFMLTIHSQRLV